MKAKLVPRIRREGRTRLEEAIPLSTPIHVFIDPSAACNFKCNFCFHADPRNKHHEIMKWDTFTRTVDQLGEFPRKLKAVRLYGFGEPLLNRRLPEMVAYTKDAGVTDFIEFTTNGWWLNPALNRELVTAGLDAITISLPGLDEATIKRSCGKDVDLFGYYRNIADFYEKKGKCRVHVKITNAAFHDHIDEALFHSLFDNICDEISIDNIVPIWPGLPGEAVEDKSIYRGTINPVEVCPYIFYHLTIHANGDVSPCFIDWQHTITLGNVNTTTLHEIWHSPKLVQMRIDNLMLNRKKYSLCAGCSQLTYGEPDNIDPYRKELRERIL